MMKILTILFVLILLVLACIYADTAYLTRSVLGRCWEESERNEIKEFMKQCDDITFKEVLFNRGKYQKLLKEKYNVTDYSP